MNRITRYTTNPSATATAYKKHGAALKAIAASAKKKEELAKLKVDFSGKSLAEMKKMYSGMTAKGREANVKNFERAAKALKKSSKGSTPQSTNTPAQKPAETKPGGKAATSTPPTTVTKPIGKKDSPAAGRGGSAKPSNSSTPRGGGSRRISGSRSRRNARNAKMSIKDIGKNINKRFKLTYEEGQKVRKGNKIFVVRNGRMVFHSRAGQSKFPGKK
tara:strand:- start:1125 stop:1775 length:651 start_codon:yes stop_codon:yes gene_type:complete